MPKRKNAEPAPAQVPGPAAQRESSQDESTTNPINLSERIDGEAAQDAGPSGAGKRRRRKPFVL